MLFTSKSTKSERAWGSFIKLKNKMIKHLIPINCCLKYTVFWFQGYHLLTKSRKGSEKPSSVGKVGGFWNGSEVT